MRGLTAPLLLVAARARRRPGRWLLPVLGIALAAAFAGAVAAEGVITGDQSARSVLQGLSGLDRSVRVTWQGVVEPGVPARARRLLRGIGLVPQTEVVLLNPVRLGGVVVRPAAISPLSGWLPGTAARRLRPCRVQSCPVLLVGGGQSPSQLIAAGVHLRVVGSYPLRSAVPLGFSPATAGEQPVLLTGDVRGLDALAGLSGVYRTHSWVALPATARLRSWQLAGLERRLERTQAALQTSGSQFSLTGPFNGLDEARAQASAAPQRLLLAGGGAVAALALFVLLAAGGLRREQHAELRRLRAAGAREIQCTLFAVAECGGMSAAALGSGAVLAIATAAILARAAGEPVGGVLDQSLLTPAAGLALAGGWLACTAVMTACVLARSARFVDLLVVAAVAALAMGLTVSTGDDNQIAVLLAPLCCLAGGVVVFRGAAAILRLGERAARRGPVIPRLALVGLARSPVQPSLAIAFVAVSVGLGGFALAYRATLARGAADQAADSVPVDAIVSGGQDFVTPLELAPLSRWRALARGTVLPVRRTEANYTSGAGTVTVPALGVPAAGLTLIHGWRTSDGSAPLPVLARRLRPSGPVRVPGPVLPPGARWIALRAASPGLGVAVIADLRDPQGAIRQVALGAAPARTATLRARVPPGRWELEALELDEPTGLAITDGHQNGENPAAATQFQARVTLGPLLALDRERRPLLSVDLGRWRGVGAASAPPPASAGAQETITFATSGMPGIVRPAQPSDFRAVPMLTDPQTAAASGPGGRLALTVDGLPVLARVVGVLKRFPTVDADVSGFVVADQATLSSALDAQLPGQGRTDELWVSSGNLASLRAALRNGPLAQLSASFRADVERGLRASPIARGVLGTLIAATVLSAALAVLGMLNALLGDSRDQRIERDLEVQGVGPRGLRAHTRVRLALASALGACAGLAIALGLTMLAVGSVRASGAVANPRPPLVTVIPWVALGAWAVGAVAVLVLAGWVATGSLIGRGPGPRGQRARMPEGGGTLREGVAR